MAGLRVWLRGLFGTRENPALVPTPYAGERVGGAKSFADDNNDFAFAMYEQLRRRPGNLFFSPFSIRTALCMAQAGARGETAAQMRGALSISPSNEALNIAFADTLRHLSAGNGGKYELAVANSLWGQYGEPLLPEYLDLIARHYGGAMNLVDFRRRAEAARATINQWVEDRTRRKIRELVPSGSLHADTRLILVNAVYFKGMWELPFREIATREEPFFLEGSGRVQARLMHRQGQIAYLQADGYQVVELIYQGGDLSMLVLLPDRRDGLPDLETTLSVRLFYKLLARARARAVELFLPRLKITRGTDMRDQLASLGMPLAFARFQADFSGINGREPPDEDSLFISAVFHKAFVEVNEEGTEAAAATAMVQWGAARVRLKPPPVPVFRADHPFLFAILDRKSGTILFLGRIADPTQET